MNKMKFWWGMVESVCGGEGGLLLADGWGLVSGWELVSGGWEWVGVGEWGLVSGGW